MIAKRLIVLLAALVMGLSVLPLRAQEVSAQRAQVEILAQYYAQYYDVPHELVRRVINRESTFNPAARNGPYYGLMQILPETARTMGFHGQPADLLDAETNLIYAVKYLRGAWLLANGSHDRAVQLYAKGYYYEAKAAGLLEETGLRPGPATPVAPAPPQFAAPVVAAVAPSAVVEPAAPTAEPAVVEVAMVDATEVMATPLGFLPPARPLMPAQDDRPEPESEALAAIAVAEAVAVAPSPAPVPVSVAQLPADDPLATQDDAGSIGLRPSITLIADTFALLDTVAAIAR